MKKLDIDEIHARVRKLYGQRKTGFAKGAPERALPSDQILALMEVLVDAINEANE